jgi:hypothetical protein
MMYANDGCRRAVVVALAAATAACLLLARGASAGMYGAGSSVVELSESGFEKKLRSGGVWLVEVRWLRPSSVCALTQLQLLPCC